MSKFFRFGSLLLNKRHIASIEQNNNYIAIQLANVHSTDEGVLSGASGRSWSTRTRRYEFRFQDQDKAQLEFALIQCLLMEPKELDKTDRLHKIVAENLKEEKIQK